MDLHLRLVDIRAELERDRQVMDPIAVAWEKTFVERILHAMITARDGAATVSEMRLGHWRRDKFARTNYRRRGLRVFADRQSPMANQAENENDARAPTPDQKSGGGGE